MSKDYTQKIRKLLNQSKQTVPYIFERFYTVLKKITLSLQQQNNEPKIFEQYSLIFRTIKKYIKEQPFQLLNNLEKVEKELRNLLNPLLYQLKQDVLSKNIFEYFSDKDTNQKINSYINQSQIIKQQFLSKNVKIKVYGTHQLSNAFWIRKFKNEYAVHFDSFWNSFLQFIEQINFFEYFISASSKSSIMKKVDPQKKYFVTSSNVSQLFYKLSEAQFLQKLADQTAKGTKSSSFKSKDFLQLQFYQNLESSIQTNLIEGQVFQITGQDTLVTGHRNKCKHSPTITFGSSLDCDIRLKNKYVSRKQLMIIQEVVMNPSGQTTILPFSLVCLSSSNFTMVSYQRPQILKIGTIFKIDDSSIQVVRISNYLKENKIEQGNDSQDETLEYLPLKPGHSVSEDKQLQYIVLSGVGKGKTGKISKENLKIQTPKKQLTIQYNQDQFYLPNQINIYVKTANQVLNGQLSSKIPIEEGMKIILEECYFQVK